MLTRSKTSLFEKKGQNSKQADLYSKDEPRNSRVKDVKASLQRFKDNKIKLEILNVKKGWHPLKEKITFSSLVQSHCPLHNYQNTSWWFTIGILTRTSDMMHDVCSLISVQSLKCHGYICTPVVCAQYFTLSICSCLFYKSQAQKLNWDQISIRKLLLHSPLKTVFGTK